MSFYDRAGLLAAVLLPNDAMTVDALRGLQDLEPDARRGAVIVVLRDEDTFLTFSYLELARAIDLLGDEIIDLPLAQTMERLTYVTSPSVRLEDVGTAVAIDRRRDAPDRRLVVVEGTEPIGVDADTDRPAPDFDFLGVDNRLFNFTSSNGGGAHAEPPPAAPEPRYLSARVEAGLERRKRAFKAGSVHTVTVGVAPGDKDLIQDDEEFEHQVPEGETHTMDVVLWAPGLLKAPLWGTFDVSHDGPSVQPMQFELPIPNDIERVEATIAVLFKNRLVHAATLLGPVVPGADDSASADSRIELRKAPPAAVDLATLRPFDASIIVNGDEVLARVGAASRSFALGGIENSVNTIQTRLFTTASIAAHTAGGLDSKPVRDLLYLLAYHGHAIYRELILGSTSEIAAAQTIEVTVRNAGDFFPIEFVYDRGVPGNGALICPNWEAPFKEGGTSCPDCPAIADPNQYLCPLGFWGLSREIARRIDPNLDEKGMEGVSLSGPSADQPRLPSLESVLIGASVKVDAGDDKTSQIKDTIALADKLLPKGAIRADTWAAWTDAVRDHQPPLLLLMPHTDMDQVLNVEVLQIGVDSNLDPLGVTDLYVQTPQGPIGPIVLLLGCNTDAPTIGYLGFVPNFLRRHAAVVIGTVAKVLGRHTGPVARQFLELAVAAQGTDAPISEVIRRARGDMLIMGNIMGLTLTAYGNADWQLAAPNQ